MNGNEGSLLRLGLEVVPADDREVVAGLRPLEDLSFLLKLLKLHRILALLDLVVREPLEMRSEAKAGHDPDEPLRRVILEPLDRIAEVHRELVVEVMVALADGAERGDEMVARSMLVVERLVPEPVGERVDAKGGVVNEDESRCAGEEKTSLPVAPAETSDKRREDKAHGEQKCNVILVLPSDNLVPREVGNVGDTDLASRLDNHPSYMGPPEALMRGVWVEFGVGISMVRSVTSRPPLDRTLHRSSASDG